MSDVGDEKHCDKKGLSLCSSDENFQPKADPQDEEHCSE